MRALITSVPKTKTRRRKPAQRTSAGITAKRDWIMGDRWGGYVHVPRAPGSTFAVCGAGAPWPTLTAFANEVRPPTCWACLEVKGQAS